MRSVVKSVFSFILVVSIGLSPVGKRDLSFSEKLAAVSVFSSQTSAHFAHEPLGKISQAYPLWSLLFAFIITSCSVSPNKENIHQLTAEIRSRIKAGEQGNSYGIVDLIEERRELIQEGDFSREDLVGKDGLDLKGIAKQIYLEFGITVEGASEETLLQVLDLLRILPSEHVKHFHGLVFNVDYDAFYDYDAGGRYYPFNPGIASFKKGRNDNERTFKKTFAHEIGHGRQLEGIGFLESFSYWWMHFALSKDEHGYACPYAQKNHWEDFAEMYERWVCNTIDAIDNFKQEKKRKIVFEKMLFVAKQFLFKKDGKFYLRVYDLLTYEDIFLDINSPDELTLSDLFDLKNKTTLGNPFSFSQGDVAQLKYKELYFVVPKIIQNPDTIYATDLFCLILEKIKNDSSLNLRQKQEQAQNLICRILFGPFSKKPLPYRKVILWGLQGRQLYAKKNRFVIEPEWVETFNELEAFFFFEPIQFRDWFIQDIDAALEKINSLFLDSLDVTQYATVLSWIPVLQKTNWDEKAIALIFDKASDWEIQLLAEILDRKVPKVFKELIKKDKSLQTALFTPNQYKLLEKLFNGDKEKVYEAIFPEQKKSQTDKIYDLVEIVLNMEADWESLRGERTFQPYLKKLQKHFSGITIEEILSLISIKKRQDDLTEEKVFALFLLLNENVENFVKFYPEWFLNRPKSQESMSPFFKLIALNKISSKAAQIFFNRLIALDLFPLWKQALRETKVEPEVENLIPAIEKALLQKGFTPEQLHYVKTQILKEAATLKQSKLNNEETFLNSSL